MTLLNLAELQDLSAIAAALRPTRVARISSRYCQRSFQVVFQKDICTEEYLRSLGLSEGQITAVMYAQEGGKSRTKECQEVTKYRGKPQQTISRSS
jgi:hypothetical protein